MAGHSKFKNIQYRKGAQDQKKAKVFTKLIKEITNAAKIGITDPDSNSRLRNSIAIARNYNVPKDRIERAISVASDPTNNENYTEIRYEGFAPNGIAIIIEALTTNKNRTAATIRSAFAKFGGNLREIGSVSYLFNHFGLIRYSATIVSMDNMLKSVMEVNIIDLVSDEISHSIYTNPHNFLYCLEFLTNQYGVPEESYIGWIPKDTMIIKDKERAETLIKLVDCLEDNDDVQRVFYNYELSDELYDTMKLI